MRPFVVVCEDTKYMFSCGDGYSALTVHLLSQTFLCRGSTLQHMAMDVAYQGNEIALGINELLSVSVASPQIGLAALRVCFIERL